MSNDVLTEHSKKLITDILKLNKFKTYNLDISNGSSKGDNYLGEIRRIKVNGTKEDDTSDSLSLILKTAPDSSDLRNTIAITMFYEKEFLAYKTILPVLVQEDCDGEFYFAKFYGGFCEVGKESYVFEDLFPKGYTMYEKQKLMDYDHISLCFKKLAQFHSLSFVLKEKNPEKFTSLYRQLLNIDGIEFGDLIFSCMKANTQKILSLVEDEEDCKRVGVYLKNGRDNLLRMNNFETTAPYNVLAHGDCWTNNFLFTYKNKKVTDMIILDWQMIKYSSPIIDLAILVFIVMEGDNRMRYYEEMLELYYNTLSLNITKMGFDISQCYPNDVYRDQIKNIMPFGFLLAVAVLPMIKPDDRIASNLQEVLNEDSGEGEIHYSENCIQSFKEIVNFVLQKNILQ